MLGNEAETLICEDIWLDDLALAERFSRLYAISFSKLSTLQSAKNRGWSDFEFKRTMYGDTEQQWADLQSLLGEVMSTEDKDRVKWTLNGNSKFVLNQQYWHLKAHTLMGYKFI